MLSFTSELFLVFMSFLPQKYLKSDTKMAGSVSLVLFCGFFLPLRGTESIYGHAHEKMEYSKSHTFSKHAHLSWVRLEV